MNMGGGCSRRVFFCGWAVIPPEIPPLRERIEDIPLLAQYFLQRYAMQSVTEQKKIEPKALEQLMRYGWPGNVRELENVIERASALCEGGIIKSEDLPAPVLYDRDSFETISEADWQVGQPLDNFVRAQERKY